MMEENLGQLSCGEEDELSYWGHHGPGEKTVSRTLDLTMGIESGQDRRLSLENRRESKLRGVTDVIGERSTGY